jgi:hypothetical protein
MLIFLSIFKNIKNSNLKISVESYKQTINIFNTRKKLIIWEKY